MSKRNSEYASSEIQLVPIFHQLYNIIRDIVSSKRLNICWLFLVEYFFYPYQSIQDLCSKIYIKIIMRQQKSQHCLGSQASISSYLYRTDISAECSVQNTCPHSSLIYGRETPILLNSMQSSLLTVGQRVRKVIPGGYKIKPRNNLRISTALQKTPGISFMSTSVENREPTAISYSCSWPESAQRELMPFCGLPKVGNQTQQWNFDGQFNAEQYEDKSNIDIDVPFVYSQDSSVSSSVNSVMEDSNGYTSEDDNYFSWSFSADDILTENEDPAIFYYQTDSKMAKKPARLSKNSYDIDFEDADFLDYGALISGC